MLLKNTFYHLLFSFVLCLPAASMETDNLSTSRYSINKIKLMTRFISKEHSTLSSFNTAHRISEINESAYLQTQAEFDFQFKHSNSTERENHINNFKNMPLHRVFLHEDEIGFSLDYKFVFNALYGEGAIENITEVIDYMRYMSHVSKNIFLSDYDVPEISKSLQRIGERIGKKSNQVMDDFKNLFDCDIPPSLLYYYDFKTQGNIDNSAINHALKYITLNKLDTQYVCDLSRLYYAHLIQAAQSTNYMPSRDDREVDITNAIPSPQGAATITPMNYPVCTGGAHDCAVIYIYNTNSEQSGYHAMIHLDRYRPSRQLEQAYQAVLAHGPVMVDIMTAKCDHPSMLAFDKFREFGLQPRIFIQNKNVFGFNGPMGAVLRHGVLGYISPFPPAIWENNIDTHQKNIEGYSSHNLSVTCINGSVRYGKTFNTEVADLLMSDPKTDRLEEILQASTNRSNTYLKAFSQVYKEKYEIGKKGDNLVYLNIN